MTRWCCRWRDPKKPRSPRSPCALASVGHDRFGTGRRRPRSDLLAQFLQRFDVDLGEGRERLNRVGEDVERNVPAYRQRGLLEPLTGLGAERVGACQPCAVAQQREEPLGIGVRARIGRDLGDLGDRDGGAVAARRGADGSRLRVGVDHLGNGLVVGHPRGPEDVVRHDLALVFADVGEGEQPVYVADGPQPLRGAEARVDRDSVCILFHADRVEPDAAHRGRCPVATSIRSPRISCPPSSSST